MTVLSTSTTVTLSVPAHPTAEQRTMLQRRVQFQSQVCSAFWSPIQSDLGSVVA